MGHMNPVYISAVNTTLYISLICTCEYYRQFRSCAYCKWLFCLFVCFRFDMILHFFFLVVLFLVICLFVFFINWVFGGFFHFFFSVAKTTWCHLSNYYSTSQEELLDKICFKLFSSDLYKYHNKYAYLRQSLSVV